ncbi:nucleoside-diphosphate sugar epimerase/dehydratase [Enterococcus faecium]|uniref:polysaccharide biosynthesis protein n=1 Tax=Enterococcus faecium TaxID=1352 RepID=UPI00100FDBDF|nr:nucleoside-diphosphate sugar epimerase/dehydratase [Enterococcus faecium]MCE3182594.1 polysaccharide biosynthesis protein [Enterococcus faecium]MCW8789443.1 polysaccharide biosynthesis protein [Enterococcus faecium]MCW8792237.1 polysaccharide biosynthesis protein [Enterococcus faecium]MDV7721746.1 nucleoside-diphosphate sugar epimerase/dehydratase [Enterococcus faecium]MDV7726842.1 nucleoside-diphosphate sugar epimerase/dehydratase [Enterococcus faecium]
MFALTRKRKIGILVVLDSLLVALACVISYLFMKPYVDVTTKFLVLSMVLSIVLYLMFGTVFKVFTRINRYTNLREIMAIFFATTCQFLVGLLVMQFFWDQTFSRRFELLSYILTLTLIIASRLSWRIFVEQRNRRQGKGTEIERTIIVGAGEGGRILQNSLVGTPTSGEIDIIGFVDDDLNKVGTYLSGKKVLGALSDLPQLIKDNQIDMVTIAIPSLSSTRLQEIFAKLADTTVKVNAMPSMEDMASGKISISRLKEIDVVDLLGREEVKLDMDSIKDQITGKVMLVTGAGGSIGSELCRQVMKFNPKQLLLLGHGENSIYQIHQEMLNNHRHGQTEFVPIIADVQDRKLIFELMAEYKPDIIYHAAAHKHVPLMEYNPREAVKNNVYGTKNVAEAAKANNVKNFVMISTDKANHPTSVMGSTKRMAEMIVTSLNEPGKTKFSAVRFGNVLGSRGSVIPLFRKQIAKGGPITVTDFRMTRYFMTIPEASRLVIQSGALAKGGEIFILDMSEPVKIVDLAKNMIRLSGLTEDDIEIVESGIRPGEKLYEELLLDKERNDEEVFEKIFVGNIQGFSIDEVMHFVEGLSDDDDELAKQVLAFANESNK